MTETIMELINNGLFPIVMCGVLCYYIFKVQKDLIKSINDNTLKIAELIVAVKGDEIKNE